MAYDDFKENAVRDRDEAASKVAADSPSSELASAFSFTNRELEMLTDIIDSVEKQLQGVMQPQSVDDSETIAGTDPELREFFTDRARQAQLFGTRVREMRHRLMSVNRRLEV